MSWNYSEKTTKLFMDAVQGKPGTHLGEIENPDGIGEHGSIACGDALRFTFRVEKNLDDPTKDKIVEARYLTFGCTSAIAASEALCAIIEEGGFTPIEALKVTNKDIVEFLEGLPDQKIHCSVMGAEALEAAVFNWAHQRGVDLDQLGIDISTEEQEEGRLVCKCFGLTEPYLRRKIEELGLKTIPDMTNQIKAGGGCMECHHMPGGLQDLLDEAWGRETAAAGATADAESDDAPASSNGGMSPYQFAKRVEQVIEEYVRPRLQADGGDMEIVDIKKSQVFCSFKGACATCIGAHRTLEDMIQRALREQVDESIQVVLV